MGSLFLNALTLHSNLHPITGLESLRTRRCLLVPIEFPAAYVCVLGIPNTFCKTVFLFLLYQACVHLEAAHVHPLSCPSESPLRSQCASRALEQRFNWLLLCIEGLLTSWRVPDSSLAMLVCIFAERLHIGVSRTSKFGRLPHGFCRRRYFMRPQIG